jgi:valyl-tRNA synthetase
MNEQLVETGRNFLTKLWNVVRFAQMNGCVCNKDFKIEDVSHPIAKWIIYQIKQMTLKVEESMDNYRFDEVTGHLYHCLWDSFCDWYMEFIKPILQQSPMIDDENKNYDLRHTLLKKDIRDTTAWAILQYIKVLYPISPFIAKKLSGEMGVLDMSWPNIAGIDINFSDAIKEIGLLKTLISSVRSMKQCLRFPLGEKVNIRVEGTSYEVEELISRYEEILYRMAGVCLEEFEGQSVPIVIGGAIIHVCLGNRINVEDEKNRLRHEITKLTKNREEALSRLANNNFLNKADDKVIEEHQKRVDSINEKIQRIDYIVQSLDVI